MKIDFEKGGGLVPAIVQDADTLQVLMLGYMNAEALAKTQETGLVTFYSRSRETLWTKGEMSGNSLTLVDMSVDCETRSSSKHVLLAQPATQARSLVLVIKAQRALDF